MASAEEHMRGIVDDMSWLDGVRDEYQRGATPKDIAQRAGVTVRTAERWRAAAGLAPNGGRQSRGAGKGPKNDAFRAEMKAKGAAAKFRSGTLSIKWKAKVDYERGGSQGSRGQKTHSPFNSMPGVADALARGDITGAGEELKRSMMGQYMPKGEEANLTITEFEELDIDW